MANRLVKGVGWTTASSIIRNVVSLLQIAILTRFLDKSDFGIIAIASLFVMFTGMFMDMGISVGIIHKQKISKEEYSSLFWLNIFLGIILTFGLFLVAPFLTSGYNSEDLTVVVQLICFTILFNSLGIQQKTFCQKKFLFYRLALIEILSAFISMGVAVYTAVNGYGVYSLAYANIAGALFGNVTHFVIGCLKDNRLAFHFRFSETKPFLKIGIFQLSAAILDFFTRELDIVILSTTLGLEFLGVYNIAKRIPVSMYSFVQPIVTNVFAPLLAEMQENKNILKAGYMKLSKTLSWISFPMYFLLGALSPTAIFLFFGNSYMEGVPVMMVFCLRYAFNGVNGVCGALQTATGRTDIGLKWTIFLIIMTSFVYYVSSLFGVVTFLSGVCFLTFIIVIMIWVIQFKPLVEVSFNEYIHIYTRSFLFSSILALSVYFLIPQPSLLFSIVSSILYVTFFGIMILKSRDGAEIVNLMRTMKVSESIVYKMEKLTK